MEFSQSEYFPDGSAVFNGCTVPGVYIGEALVATPDEIRELRASISKNHGVVMARMLTGSGDELPGRAIRHSTDRNGDSTHSLLLSENDAMQLHVHAREAGMPIQYVGSIPEHLATKPFAIPTTEFSIQDVPVRIPEPRKQRNHHFRPARLFTSIGHATQSA